MTEPSASTSTVAPVATAETQTAAPVIILRGAKESMTRTHDMGQVAVTTVPLLKYESLFRAGAEAGFDTIYWSLLIVIVMLAVSDPSTTIWSGGWPGFGNVLFGFLFYFFGSAFLKWSAARVGRELDNALNTRAVIDIAKRSGIQVET